MASNRSSVIQFNDDQDAQSELQFQDFSLGESTSGVATLSPTGTYTSFPNSPDTQGAESEDLLGGEKKEESSFWKFSYYQSFFDIETVDFLERLKWSFIPVLGRATFLDRQIRPKPDLYGPFWITFCLVYSTAVMSNVANYFNGAHQEKKDWAFNFHRVSLAATSIYAYVFILPIIIWGVLRHFQYSNRYTLLEIVCVYGYSLAIFVPISIFWIFDAAWLHWILVIIGIVLTGAVLAQIFWPIFRDDNKKTGTILLCIILFFHILLGVGFGTLFFQQRFDWSSTSTTIAPAHTTTTTTAAVEIDKAVKTRSIESDMKETKTLPTLDKAFSNTGTSNSLKIPETSKEKSEVVTFVGNRETSESLSKPVLNKTSNLVNKI